MISIKTQKIVMFIPFVNAAILFFYIFNALKAPWRGKKFLNGMAFAAVGAVIVTVIYRILSILQPQGILNGIILFLYMYAFGLSIGYILIKYQIRLGAK